ncbi:MAG: P-II family nitrogen regulator [Actinobacteria bacterium]|nr:P-II family nitrogen regulator [Actinomycetota bacterium]
MLKKIECFIQPFKLDAVMDAIIEAGVEGISMSEVKGFGRQRGFLKGEVPNKLVKLLPKVKLEMVIDEEKIEEVTKTLVKLCQTGEFGAGKIFVLPVEDAIRIRTQESGISAIV